MAVGAWEGLLIVVGFGHVVHLYDLTVLVNNRLFIISFRLFEEFNPNMDIRPNHTIYINNMNDKIKKEGMFF